MGMKTQKKYMLSICLFQSASQFLLSQASTDADKGLCLDTFMTVEVKHKEGEVNAMVELYYCTIEGLPSAFLRNVTI